MQHMWNPEHREFKLSQYDKSLERKEESGKDGEAARLGSYPVRVGFRSILRCLKFIGGMQNLLENILIT